jgi:replicative DNA helicase
MYEYALTAANYEYGLIHLLLNGSKEKETVFKMLTREHFIEDKAGAIFDAMKELYNKDVPIDINTVSDKMQKELFKYKEFLTTNITIFLSKIATDGLALFGNELYYAEVIEENYVRRKFIIATEEIQKLTKEKSTESLIDLKNEAVKLLSDIKISTEKGIGESIYDVVDEYVEDLLRRRDQSDDEAERLYTGFRDFDKIMAGLHKQEFTIIGARPAVGKTQFAMALAKRLAKRNNNILFFSREMGNMQLANRFVSNMTEIEGSRLRRPKELSDNEIERIKNAHKEFKETKNMSITFNTTATTVQEIRSVVREMYLQKTVDVVMIDYLGLLQSSHRHGDRRTELEYISRQLKLMSLEYDLPIVCLSQLSRNSQRENREPELYDLRDTGAIEQDADNVLFLHIPEWVDVANDERFAIKLIVAKQRGGSQADIWLLNERNKMSIDDLPLDELAEIKRKNSEYKVKTNHFSAEGGSGVLLSESNGVML